MRSGSGRGVRRTPPPWFIPTPLPLPLPSSPHVSHPSIQPSTHTPIQPIPRTPITGQASLAPGRQNLIAYPTTAFNWAAGSTSALPTLESPLAVNAEGEKRHGYARQVLGVRRFEPGGRSHTLGQSRQRSSKAGRQAGGGVSERMHRSRATPGGCAELVPRTKYTATLDGAVWACQGTLVAT